MRMTLAAAATAALCAAPVPASPTIYHDAIEPGTSAFDAAVAAVNGTLLLDQLDELGDGRSWQRDDFIITSTNNGYRGIDTRYLPMRLSTSGTPLGGHAIGINPQANAAGSGLTFSFDTPVNFLGLEVGDWATCCFASSLYIAFDGGATRLVASADEYRDNPGYVAGDGFRNFVGAFDDSGTFESVSFYGDGVGEYLVAGGTIRYGTVGIGSVSGPATAVPSPGALALLGLGAAAITLRRRSLGNRGGRP